MSSRILQIHEIISAPIGNENFRFQQVYNWKTNRFVLIGSELIFNGTLQLQLYNMTYDQSATVVVRVNHIHMSLVSWWWGNSDFVFRKCNTFRKVNVLTILLLIVLKFNGLRGKTLKSKNTLCIKALVELRHLNHNFVKEMSMWLFFTAINSINKVLGIWNNVEKTAEIGRLLGGMTGVVAREFD